MKASEFFDTVLDNRIRSASGVLAEADRFPPWSTQDRQIGTVTALRGMESADDPRNWRIKVSQQHIELYLEFG